MARLGVIACLAAALAATAVRLDSTFGVIDWRADGNARRGYLERLLGDSTNVVGSRRVVDDGRLWMPEDATYRIVGRPSPQHTYDIRVAPDFLRYYLLPRRESPDARWVFCFGCDVSAFGGRLETLSEENGVRFGRLRR